MSVIIRLQGLPWTASAMNIRHFFTGLNIPAGGVHIIGGEGGDAFIAFSSDEDARMAMKMNSSLLNGVPVQLFLSSKSEMQSVIDAARSGNPSTQAAASQAQTSMAGGMAGMSHASAAGGNSMGHAMMPTGQAMMPDHAQQSSGYPGMQAQGQQNMMGQKNPFQMMQQQRDMNMPGVGNLGGDMNARNDWQNYPGMSVQENQAQSQNPNAAPFQQNMMAGGQDACSRFPHLRQHNMEDSFSGPGRQPAYGRQGQDMTAEGEMATAGQKEGMVPPHPSRFSDTGVRPSPSRGGIADKPGQIAGAEETAAPGLMPTPRAGSASKDETVAMDDPLGRGRDGRNLNFQMDRFGRNQLPLEQLGPTGSNMGSWGANKKPDENLPDNNRFQPDASKDPMFRQGMNREDPLYKRGERRRPNRFAERPENTNDPDSFNMGTPGYPDKDGMQDQLFDNYRNRREAFPGRYPDRAQGYPEGERGKPAGADDGLPSTRYPPDDEPLGAAPDADKVAGGRGMMDDFRGMPGDRRLPPGDRRFDQRRMDEEQRGYMDGGRGYPDDQRRMSEERRGMADEQNPDRRFGPRVSRFDRDEMGMSVESGLPPNDRRERPFLPEDRGFPRTHPRYPHDDRFGDFMDRDANRDDRFYSGERPPLDGGRRMREGEQDFPPRDGRPMPEDRMWPRDRSRPDEMMGRMPGDNPFAPDDPRFKEKEEELRREAFERGARGDDERFHGYGRGGMRGMGRGDGFGGRYPPERRPGFPLDRGFRDEDRDRYPYYPEGSDERRFDNMAEKDRPGAGQKPGLLETPESAGAKPPERGSSMNKLEAGDPMDMDQRFDREMRPGRRPGMFREEEGFEYGRGAPGEDGYGRGAPPRDFDTDHRGLGPRGRGGAIFDRGGRGRGDPFGRGRPGGPPPFGRGRGRDERHFDDNRMDQDVDSRALRGPAPGGPLPPDQLSGLPGTGPSALGPRGLLGDAPGDQGAVSVEKTEEPKNDMERKDLDNRVQPPRRSDDRDRDRRYDNRRGRDRDERDRYSYRGRYDRDRDRDRDRRRSRSRSRDRRSRERDRYGRDSSRDNRDRSSRDKTSKSDPESGKLDSSKTQHPSRYIAIKNMSKSVSFREIRRFFQPMEIPFDGIKIINDDQGNRIGDAFVYFHRLDDAVKSQRKDGERVEGRSVSVQFTTEEEFKKAIDSFVPLKTDEKPAATPPAAKGKPESNPSDKTRYIVKMTNMPQSITRQNISNFFKNLKIEKDGEAAYIEFDQSGVATGMGFVEFKSDIDYKKALTLDGTLLGTQNVRVLPGEPGEADKLKAMQGEMFQRAALRSIATKTGVSPTPRPTQGSQPLLGSTSQPQQPQQKQPEQKESPAQTTPISKPLIPPVEKSEPDNACIHIQGLPLLATHHDIRDFFADCQIVTRGINIAHDGVGKPLGEGFVEFKSKADVDKALKKDKTSLGRHIVAVKLIAKKDMMERLGNAKSQGVMPPKFPHPNTPTSSSDSPQAPSPLNTPQRMQPPKPQSPLDNSGRNPQQAFPQQPQFQQRNPGQQPAQRSPFQPPDAAGSNSNGPPPPANQPQTNSSAQPPKPTPPPQDAGNNKGPAAAQSPQQSALLQTPMPIQSPGLVVAPGGGKSFPPGVLNNNWFYVRCQNFPPDITIGEIMQFFNMFRPIGESIRLHYSSEGHPTGNAVVGFNTPEDANRAMQRLHMRPCRHNPVNLQPA